MPSEIVRHRAISLAIPTTCTKPLERAPERSTVIAKNHAGIIIPTAIALVRVAIFGKVCAVPFVVELETSTAWKIHHDLEIDLALDIMLVGTDFDIKWEAILWRPIEALNWCAIGADPSLVAVRIEQLPLEGGLTIQEVLDLDLPFAPSLDWLRSEFSCR